MPVTYDPSMEIPEKDEAETTQKLVEQMTKIQTIVDKDEAKAFRAVHAKSHGILLGELVVDGDVPASLQQGLFAKPGRYPVIIRLSTPPGDLLDDKVSTPRGMAVKVIGVEGSRVSSSEGDSTQDFVMVNGPAFSAPTAGKFLNNVKLLAGTTDKAPGLKKALSTALQGVEALLEKTGHKSATLTSLGGHPETHILGETFYSQAPLLFGPYIAKVSVAPVSPGLTALTDAPLDLTDHPDGIRDAVIDHFASQDGEWEVRAQLCTDLEAMPIEDASVPWPEEQSPYVRVARIVVKPQDPWSVAKQTRVDQGMSFSPWHALAAHRPLGSVNRVRKTVYEMSKKFRASHNGVSAAEPTSVDGL